MSEDVLRHRRSFDSEGDSRGGRGCPPEKRERILDEFERSGMTGMPLLG